ncbi:hypothetical protein TCAL_07330 [Tigriopus californicus]|uniref:Carbohydrate sulfotransferase n=1 Tax=Tigriopus californicus TaxID=6832 RepID=A0A553NX45_TIGCA|nr:carbohydrate sulfotransferase 11-like isoform X1 [Tigriopus californicus]XP_059090624.1 carbohydrate sulfotransferase 11-like isoform X1 [Tigriopus californicus]TRY70004.1 hypothetical protein TCAL_07330 [Tigriopus californicus]|eukprot:TCALIF_07330-PA protein Name:"Protein of unknown function" AED:0.00 eAED:0.00 QI:247/1/1/1/0.66/0.5/4/565/395
MTNKRQGLTKKTNLPSKVQHQGSKMSKVVNFYSVGLVCSLSMALVAYQYSGTSMEDVGEQIALKLLEILPRKQQENFDSFPTSSSNDSDEVNPRQRVVTETEDAILLTKESKFNPVGHYNAKQAMEKRYEGLQNICMKYSDFMRPERAMLSQVVPYERYIYDPQSDLAMCKLDRVAKASFVTFFNRGYVGGTTVDGKKSNFKSNFPRSLKDARKAIIVRHPLERLVSAYRSKYEKVFNAHTNEEEGGEITFQDFVDIILRGPMEYAEFLEENNLHGQSVAIDTGMIDGLGDSAAWDPYWKQCGVCNPLNQPHYILHLDHIKEDSKVFAELLGNRSGQLDWTETLWQPKSGIREIEEHYFSQISKNDIRDLFDKYRLDHELFGFSPDYYIALGQDS